MNDLTINNHFKINAELLLQHTYFKDLIENVNQIDNIELNFNEEIIHHFVDYLHGKNQGYTKKDIKFAKYIVSDQYLIHIIQHSQFNDEVFSWILDSHLINTYINEVVEYLEQFHDQPDILKLYLQQMHKFELFDFIRDYPLFYYGRKFIYLMHTICGVKTYPPGNIFESFPINKNYYTEEKCLRTKLYLNICQIAYDLFGNEILEYINNNYLLYEWISLLEFLNIDINKFMDRRNGNYTDSIPLNNDLSKKLFELHFSINKIHTVIMHHWMGGVSNKKMKYLEYIKSDYDDIINYLDLSWPGF